MMMKLCLYKIFGLGSIPICYKSPYIFSMSAHHYIIIIVYVFEFVT